MMDHDFEELTAAWLGNCDLTKQRRDELLRRLRNDATFRAEFVQDVQMHGMTRAAQAAEPRWLDLEELLAPEDAPADLAFEERVANEWDRIDAGRGAFNWLRWLGLGFAMLAIWTGSVLLAFKLGSTSPPPEVAAVPPKAGEPRPQENIPHPPIAVLSRIVNPNGTNEPAQQKGMPLSPGVFDLAGGLAQLDFVGGARLLVRGPASLELTSAAEARLLTGSATCSVDGPGRDFRLSVPGGSVVDTDGSFGLHVSNGRSEFHAIRGRLTVEDARGRVRDFAEATAVKLAGTAFEPVAFQPAFFPDMNELKRLESEAVADRSVDWWEHAQNCSRDPETLLHYTFMSDVYRERRVENHAPEADNDSHGIIIGAKFAEGRWPWKKALEFRKRTDRVLLGLPGHHPHLTLAAWLRIDAFTREQNVLLRTKHPERRNGDNTATTPAMRERGEIRWVIARSGVVQFKVATGSTEGGQAWDSAATPRLFKDDAIGQWALLAVTYDAESGAVTHYWNGKPVAKSLMSNAAPLAFEYLELGNPGLTDDEHRNGDRYGFFGSLDELLISRRVLDEREIAALFIAGKPAS